MNKRTQPANQVVVQSAELSENDKFIRLTVDLPGVYAKDLEVDITHGVLSIGGVRKTMSIDGQVCLKKHKFSRKYAIDTDVVDVSAIRANLAQGVLTIKAPKRSKMNRIRIGVTEENVPHSEAVAEVPNVPIEATQHAVQAATGTLTQNLPVQAVEQGLPRSEESEEDDSHRVSNEEGFSQSVELSSSSS